MAPIRPRLRTGQLSAAEGFPKPEEGKSKPEGRKIKAGGRKSKIFSFPKSEPFQRVAPTSGHKNSFVSFAPLGGRNA
jgi:hypothetical protein